MPNNRTAAALQHMIQYPAGHLDRWASFGPAFEMAESTSQPAAAIVAPAADSQPAGDTAASQPALDDPKRFILAVSGTIAGAKAIFTLQGVSARYTYKVTRKDPEIGSRYTEPAYFVALLTGPDNTSDYTYVGMLQVSSGTIRLTKASRYTADSQPVKAFNWAISRIWQGKTIAPASIYHAGYCGRCGRQLTVPESVSSGFGPECASKL